LLLPQNYKTTGKVTKQKTEYVILYGIRDNSNGEVTGFGLDN
jgi:hypothetical protein